MFLPRTALSALCAFIFTTSMVPIFALAEAPGTGSTMPISNGNLVSLEYTLTLEDKTVLDTNVGGKPLNFTQGTQQIIPGLEVALLGMKPGESKHVTVEAKDGYGELDPRRVQEIPIEQIPENARKVGTQLEGQGPKGQVIRSTVKEVKGKMIVLDFNHPLAGKKLFFDVTVLDVQAGPTP